MSASPEGTRLVRLWVEKAENDLRNAAYTLTMEEDCPLDTVCFHAQQCAEKYIKALLTSMRIEFHRTHDLLELVWLLPEEIGLRSEVASLSELNRYAVEARYPGDWEPITREDAEAALATAGRVRDTLRAHLPHEVVPTGAKE